MLLAGGRDVCVAVLPPITTNETSAYLATAGFRPL
jgi:hypothetical protein